MAKPFTYAVALALVIFPMCADPQVFKESVSVEAVPLYLTATDSDGDFVTDLRADDIRILENGVTQTIDEFLSFADDKTSVKVPLTLFFLLDGSTSMRSSWYGQTRMDMLKRGMLQFLQQVDATDRIKIIAFNTDPWVVVPLTDDGGALTRGVQAMEIREGRTALYDGLVATLEEMKGFSGRKVLVVCSDGMDTASQMSVEQLREHVKVSDEVTILAFGTAPLRQHENTNRNVLSSLARLSGGSAVFPETEAEIGTMIQMVRREMKAQYLVTYKPARAEEKRWREIRIISRRPGLKLRYRPGYYID